MLMSSRPSAAWDARPYAASESFPPEKETVTGRFLWFFSARNALISLTPLLAMDLMCARLLSTKPSMEHLAMWSSEGLSRSLILTARSTFLIDEESARAIPAPTFAAFLSMRVSPSRNSPTTSVTLAPGTVLPLRCPDIPAKVTTFFVATGAKRSAPGCLISRTRRSSLMSNLRIPRTSPYATISSVRSSPGTLFRNIMAPSSGPDVPNASSKSFFTMPTESPMQGLMSPGLLTSNSLPSEPHTEQLPPRSSVPHASHHLNASLPWAEFLLSPAIGHPSAVYLY